jgi:hypothetical protein
MANVYKLSFHTFLLVSDILIDDDIKASDNSKNDFEAFDSYEVN